MSFRFEAHSLQQVGVLSPVRDIEAKVRESVRSTMHHDVGQAGVAVSENQTVVHMHVHGSLHVLHHHSATSDRRLIQQGDAAGTRR